MTHFGSGGSGMCAWNPRAFQHSRVGALAWETPHSWPKRRGLGTHWPRTSACSKKNTHSGLHPCHRLRRPKTGTEQAVVENSSRYPHQPFAAGFSPSRKGSALRTFPSPGYSSRQNLPVAAGLCGEQPQNKMNVCRARSRAAIFISASAPR